MCESMLQISDICSSTLQTAWIKKRNPFIWYMLKYNLPTAEDLVASWIESKHACSLATMSLAHRLSTIEMSPNKSGHVLRCLVAWHVFNEPHFACQYLGEISKKYFETFTNIRSKHCQSTASSSFSGQSQKLPSTSSSLSPVRCIPPYRSPIKNGWASNATQNLVGILSTRHKSERWERKCNSAWTWRSITNDHSRTGAAVEEKQKLFLVTSQKAEEEEAEECERRALWMRFATFW